MEENILMLILSEYELDQTPKNILIDEAVRLSKNLGLTMLINLLMPL